MNNNKIGLIVGLLFAIIHAIWSFFIAVVPNQLQNFLDWVMELHSIEPYLTITAFNFFNAVFLVIVTFVFGYLIGYLFAALWNWMHKASHAREKTSKKPARRKSRKRRK
jgi:hypothetical protein